jgi:triacylglycerol lipase
VLCARLDAPIVLAHGLFGFRRIGMGRLTLTSYFRGIPEYLRTSGNRVMVTRVPPIAGVKPRARRLGEQIAEAFPGEPVHLIGHSMGGLDARHLLADPAWSGKILSLTTIGTPHLGSALADCARLRVGPVYRLLRMMKIDHRGFHDVTRRAARSVHRKIEPPEGVPCFSVAGNPALDEVCWPLRGLYEALYRLEGPNDGLVSVESALAFGTPLPTKPVDHLRQMNWLAPVPGVPASPPTLDLYREVVENLAQQGFAARSSQGDDAALIGGEHAGTERGPAGILQFGRQVWDGWLRGSPIEKNGHRHVAQHVRGGPAAVEKPVDRQEDGDLVGWQTDSGEDQRQGHKAS